MHYFDLHIQSKNTQDKIKAYVLYAFAANDHISVDIIVRLNCV